MSQKFLSSVALTGISNGSILKVNSSGEIVAAVAGTDYVSSATTSQWTTSGNDIYYNTGNVGIGESSPDGILHLKGSAQATEFYIESSTGTASTSGAIKIAQNNRSAESLAGEMVFYVQDNNVGGTFWREAMAIINNGNVGIGNSSPGNNRLKVTGATDITGTLTLSGYTAGLLKTDSSGTVSLDTNTYLTTSTASTTYLPLTGGTVANGNNASPLTIGRTSASALQVGVKFSADDGESAPSEVYFGMGTDGNPYWASTANLTAGSEIWHAGNDGASSGLDADLLDGNHASAFASSATFQTFGTANRGWLMPDYGGNASNFLRMYYEDGTKELRLYSYHGTTSGAANLALYDGSAYATVTPTKIGNWDTAYGWGNHASAGYITSLSGYATTTYVDTAVSNLVDSAPTALNTLNELAAALGDDASFSTTVSTALGNRLRLDSAVDYTTAEKSTGRSNLGLGSAATSATTDFAAASHNHDSRYYTETEVDTLLAGKASTDTATTTKNGLMSSTDKTKLDGIESGADVTDATNVAAAGALMASGGTLSGTMKVTGSIIHEYNTNAGYIAFPKGGMLQTSTASHTGAIKIKLPVHGGDDMIKFVVDIYDYSVNESLTILISGYVYQTTGGNEWVNCTATTLTKHASKDFTVRFGADGTNSCVWIGETNSPWSYPNVLVRDFYGGFYTDIDAYDDNWSVTIVTSFDTVDETVSNNLPTADWDRIVGKPVNATTSVDGLMSSTDKTKLDGIEASANNYSLPLGTSTTRGGFKIGYTETSKNYAVKLSSEQMYVTVPWTDTTYSTATSTTAGLVKIGYPESGKNYPVELNASGQMYVNVPWVDTDTTYSEATESAAGLMSASMVTKLDGIADGAEVNVQADWNQTTTTADDYIKNKPSLSFLPLSGGTVTGVLTLTGSSGVSRLRIEGTTPTIDLDDSDGDSFYIHVNSNNFYVLTDRDGGGNYGNWESPHPLQLEADTNKAFIFGSEVKSAAFTLSSDYATASHTHTNADSNNDGFLSSGDYDKFTTAFGWGDHAGLYASSTHNHNGTYTYYDHIRSLGSYYINDQGSNATCTTAQFITEIENGGAFDSYTSVFKTPWDYAGNNNISDGGTHGPGELAGMSFITWTDNSNDTTRGNITVLGIAPNTGGSAGGVYVWNDQGSGYAPGWREIWTSATHGSGSGLDADLLDGNHASDFATSAQGAKADSALQSIAANSIGAAELNVSGNGTTAQYLRSDADGSFTWATPTNTTYSTATSTTLGLVKIGYTESGKNYPVELSNGQMYVNVPWTDTDTTYSDATQGQSGLMSSEDKTKLDGIEENANNYSPPASVKGFYEASITTAAATAAKTATISGYTLTAGDFIIATFTAGNSVSNPTLSINGGAAVNIRIHGTANVSTTTMSLGANSVVLLYYDGTYFFSQGSFDTSDGTESYTVRWNSTHQVGDALYDYKLCMYGSDGKLHPLTLEEGTGTSKTINTADLDFRSPILWYNRTTNVSADGTSGSYWYNSVSMGNLHYTANQSGGWTNYRPIYVKGSINSEGWFNLDNSSSTAFLTQDLPTSDDGYVYILMGYIYGTNSMRLVVNNPIYEYKNGQLRPYAAPQDWSEITGKPGDATASTSGFMSSTDKSKLDNIAANANNYSLPLGTATTRGGFKVGYVESGKNYPVELSSEKMYVNVPWTDTTYTAATTTANGLMSSTDKSKLDGIASNANNYSLPSDISVSSVTIGSGVTLSESTDRADLLSINSGTSGWGGLQVTNTAGDGILSLMVDGSNGGLYDDQNSDWILYYTENAGVELRYNAAAKITTLNTGVVVSGEIQINNGSTVIKEGANNSVNISTGTGSIDIGSMNASWVHIQADRDIYILPGTGGKVAVDGNLTPYSDNAKTLGASGARWSTIYGVTGTFSGDVVAYSDARVKENVETIETPLDKVMKLRGVSFNRTGEDRKNIGVIAQEIREVLPEVVHEQEDGMLAVAYGNIVGLLIEAMKEQQQQIEELKSMLGK